MTEDWVRRAVASNPILKLENGNVRTCPVRLKWCNLFKATTGVRGSTPDPNKTPTFGASVLFPPGAEQGINAILWPEALAAAKRDFPGNFGPDGQWFGLHSPFKQQSEKQTFTGFTPGLLWISVSTQYKPQIVDAAMNPIIDEGRVYDGVWAILALNTYTYGSGKNPQPKKGPAFGIQTVMIVADDEVLIDAKQADPRQDFAGVQIDASFNPAAQFGGPAMGAGAAPGSPAGFGLLPPPVQVGGPALAPPPPGAYASAGYPAAPPAPAAAPRLEDLI